MTAKPKSDTREGETLIALDSAFYGAASRDDTEPAFVETEANPRARHERTFGKEKTDGAALFYRKGDRIVWITPRTRRDERSVEKHYGEKLAHLSLDEYTREGNQL